LNIHPWAEPLLRPHCGKTGICAFPNYKKCPIQPFTIKPSEEQLEKINNKWIRTSHEANPIAKDGRTM